MKIQVVVAVCLVTLAQSRNIFDQLSIGLREEGDHCEEFANYRDQLHAAIGGLSKECKKVAPANQCVIPTVEILKQCLGDNFVDCAKNIYEVTSLFEYPDTFLFASL